MNAAGMTAMPAEDASRMLAMTTYSSASNTRPIETRTVEWGQVVEQFKMHEVRTSKDGKAFTLGQLKPGSTRKNEHVEFLSAVVLDHDDGTSLEELTRALREYEFLAVSTYGHTKKRLKCRLIIPLTRDVSPQEWPRIWEGANALVGGHADKAAKDPSRLYYFPSCPAETASEAFIMHNEGRWLDPDTLVLEKPHLISSKANPFRLNAGAADGIDQSPDEDEIIEEGGRHTRLVELVGSWIGTGKGYGETLQTANQWNEEKCRPPLPETEVLSVAKGIWEKHTHRPETVVQLQSLTTRSDSPWPLREVPSGRADTPDQLFNLDSFRIDRYLNSPPPQRRWLLNNCLPSGKVGAIIAPGGTGKSQYVLQLAASIATGLPLADGAWTVGETGGVLVLAAEDDIEEIHRRVHNVAEVLTKTYGEGVKELLAGRLFVKSMVAENNLMTAKLHPGHREVYPTDYVTRLIALARQDTNLRLIIIDPAARFRGGEENSAEDMTRFVEVLEFVSKETGAAVLVVHHANKSSMRKEEQSQIASRGSSAFTDGVRWQMNLATLTPEEAKKLNVPDEERRFYLSAPVTKSNYSAPQPVVYLRRGEGGYLHKADLVSRSNKKADELIVRIVKKVAELEDPVSAAEFERQYGGVENVFGVGRINLRGLINKSIEAKYIEKGIGKTKPLCVTKLGHEMLRLKSSLDNSIAR